MRYTLGGALVLIAVNSLCSSATMAQSERQQLPRAPTIEQPEWPVTLRGVLRSFHSGDLIVNLDDFRIVSLKLQAGLKVRGMGSVDDLVTGDYLEIRALDNEAGWLSATAITRLPSRPPEPKMIRESSPRSEDPLLASAYRGVQAWATALPNFRCRQTTERLTRRHGAREWERSDLISAEVVYERGRETYHDVRVNGASGMPADELPGFWSSGEYANTLRALFSPKGVAVFGSSERVLLRGRTAAKYPFRVARADSDWRIQYGSQTVFPPYTGAVWLDVSNGEVLRVEAKTGELPAAFPLVKVESYVEYATQEAAGVPAVLPVRAETLLTHRKGLEKRNLLKFDQYRRFGAKSEVTFEK